MKSDYHEKRAARIQRMWDLSRKKAGDAQASFDKSDRYVAGIPPGQPILVGHHSEKRHRKALDNCHNAMRKGVELDKQAAHYERRAEAAESNHVISSDNPDAVELLEEKLQKLQQIQENVKAANKIVKSKKLEVEKVAELVALGFSEQKAMQLITPDYMNRIGFPSYVLQNNNGNMARIKQRIEQLKKFESMEEKEVKIGEVKILSGPDTNRVQIFFPGKPAENVRTELKHAGFRWSPREGAWQRNLSNHAQNLATELVKKYYE